VVTPITRLFHANGKAEYIPHERGRPECRFPANERPCRNSIMFRQAFLIAINLCFLLLTADASRAQGGAGCTLSIDGLGGTSAVMINASGCGGDTIAIDAGADGNEKQFPLGRDEFSTPFNLTQCDLDLDRDRPVSLTYTAVVVSGPDKGLRSTPYTGTLAPDSAAVDEPPGVSLTGKPGTGNFVRSGDSIALSVTATDDFGLTAIKVTGPGGLALLDQPITPAPSLGSKCHRRPARQSVTLDARPYVVPQNPPVPIIRFTAVARDTAGHESTSTAEYLTEATWTGNMLLNGSGGASGNICTSNWRIALTVKTTGSGEATGYAEARHTPIAGCRYAGPRDNSNGVILFAIRGTFERERFRLFFEPKAMGGAGVAWGVTGLHLLMLPSPLPVDLTLFPGDYSYAKGPVTRGNSGNLEGSRASAFIDGQAFLQCCFKETGPPTPQRAPLFLGEGQEPVPLGPDSQNFAPGKK
jgi:hypothetical protein